jgi:hypothetical protein
MPKKSLVLVLLVLAYLGLKAQVDVRDSAVSAFIPNFAYAFQMPGGDVADEYGMNSTIGGGFLYKTKKNFVFSLDINFIFGNDIKNADTILWMVETDNGYIIDGNGTYALYSLYERGYSLNLRVGKVLNVLSANPNSGLFLMLGTGYLVHRMKIDNQDDTAPQITGDYAKGYDNLIGGLNLNQFIGYYFMGRSRIANFYAGFEFYQAFTKSQRDYNFNMMEKNNNHYVDFFYGVKVAWMFPVFKRAPDPYYYQ